MDKYIEVLCKQNPKMEMECSNPDCRKKFNVKTTDFFKNKSYVYKCDKCEKETNYDTTKFVNDFKKKLEKMGVTVK